jgi:hypothetical protein
MYLQVACENGLFGFGLYLWVIILSFGALRRLNAPWRAAALATFVAFLVAGLTESWNNDKEVTMLVWTMVGLAMPRGRASAAQVPSRAPAPAEVA